MPVERDICPNCLGIENPDAPEACYLCRGYGVVCPTCRGAKYRRERYGAHVCGDCSDAVEDDDGRTVAAINPQRLADTIAIYRERNAPTRLDDDRWITPDGEIIGVQ